MPLSAAEIWPASKSRPSLNLDYVSQLLLHRGVLASRFSLAGNICCPHYLYCTVRQDPGRPCRQAVSVRRHPCQPYTPWPPVKARMSDQHKWPPCVNCDARRACGCPALRLQVSSTSWVGLRLGVLKSVPVLLNATVYVLGPEVLISLVAIMDSPHCASGIVLNAPTCPPLGGAIILFHANEDCHWTPTARVALDSIIKLGLKR